LKIKRFQLKLEINVRQPCKTEPLQLKMAAPLWHATICDRWLTLPSAFAEALEIRIIWNYSIEESACCAFLPLTPTEFDLRPRKDFLSGSCSRMRTFSAFRN
ncbi:hypothetical protein, partial [uncultured Sutterella sp.]|uniref:hypothetical protein n=1 Tax=uncultured Sutterella sp. TaxID=286133 RepID=UPI0026226239